MYSLTFRVHVMLPQQHRLQIRPIVHN